MSKYAFLFSGQGSQYVSMGRDLKDVFPIAREIFESADDFLCCNFSKIMFEGPKELLLETANSQLAIYIHGMALFKILAKELPELVPCVVSGLSLGEYTALTAAGKIAFSDGLEIVKLRADFMDKACRNSKGDMAAVLGLSSQDVEQVVSSFGDGVWIANYNSPTQTVISGNTSAIQKISGILKIKGARKVVPLSVSGAFHSPLMKDAEDRLKEYLVSLVIQDSPINFVSNVIGDYVQTPEEIRELLKRQITSSTRWFQGCLHMANHVDSFLEIGCGKVLSGLNKSIGITQPTCNVDSLLSLENFLKIFEDSRS